MREAFEVHVFGALLLTRALAPAMMQRGSGTIVNGAWSLRGGHASAVGIFMVALHSPDLMQSPLAVIRSWRAWKCTGTGCLLCTATLALLRVQYRPRVIPNTPAWCRSRIHSWICGAA